MSIVEKAAEKLRTLQSDPDVATLAAVADPAPVAEPARATPSIERLHGRSRPVEASAPVEPPWHVDEAALRGVGATADEASWRLLDEMRRAKRPLLDNATGKGARPIAHAERIVVTSAVPGEGKTFTTVSLALSLAREPDFEVLLVDGDVPKSDITRRLGLEDRPGLMDVLADESREPSEVVVHTDVPNLLVVPAGGQNALGSELFGGRRMDYVLEAFGHSRRPRLVVFDSPPLLAISDAPVLVSHMGQVVMVVAAGHTRQQDVRSALESLAGSQYVGLILNKSSLPASESHYYGGYYGHHYGKNA
ncbi:MAG TPA: AAA family ATPase [Rhodanobacteraceae bacterium]